MKSSRGWNWIKRNIKQENACFILKSDDRADDHHYNKNSAEYSNNFIVRQQLGKCQGEILAAMQFQISL